MSFIDASYFIGELNIPNSDNPAVAERISLFINKYEPAFLQQLFGYPLYKAFILGMAAASPQTRFLDILFGKEYTDFQGYTQKWQGLIVTDSPTYNLAGGFVYKKPEYLIAGVTPGFNSGVNTASFPDWIGWTPIITRIGVMNPGVDYSWDTTTGILTLLKAGDLFGFKEYFFVQFELRTDSVPVSTAALPNQSLIANYIFYWYMRSLVTSSMGIGEVITSAENAVNASPRQKMISAWNEMKDWVKDFVAFMDSITQSGATTYPEWTDVNKINALKTFGFINPIF